jgi:hypothetical protein
MCCKRLVVLELRTYGGKVYVTERSISFQIDVETCTSKYLGSVSINVVTHLSVSS